MTPKIVVVDCSMAILNALSISLAGMSGISEYSDRLFQCLQNDNFDLKCLIHLDICHTVKMFARMNVHETKFAKHFLTRSLCLLITTSSLNDCEHILEAIIIVAGSSHEGCFSSKTSVVREKIQFLRECISDHGFIIEDLAYDKEEINEKK